jgi:hypothetical protein
LARNLITRHPKAPIAEFESLVWKPSVNLVAFLQPCIAIDQPQASSASASEMHDEASSNEHHTAPGPRPSVYTVLKIIGCRQHWLAVSGGWTANVNHWTQSWVSSEREVAYQAAKRAGGLLVRWTQAEWAALLEGAIGQNQTEDHGAPVAQQ